jgi:hypothetical protein
LGELLAAMKILTQANARVLWYVQSEDINPNGLDLIPIYASLQARYKFRVAPSKPEEFQPASGGVVFAKGSFTCSDGQVVEIIRFEIFSDGLMVDTRATTRVSEEVLGDILQFASQAHRLTFDRTMVKRKAYVSEVVATTQASLGSLNPRLQEFSLLLSEACGQELDFQPEQIRFGTDIAQAPVSLKFRFERREGVHFSENRYYSLAPTTTEKHQELLDALEAILVT